MKRSKSLILLLILMSILLIGCRSNYHTGANTMKQVTSEKEQEVDSEKVTIKNNNDENTRIAEQSQDSTEQKQDTTEKTSGTAEQVPDNAEETSDTTEQTKREIPYTRFENCLYVWEDEVNPSLLHGYVTLSENIDNQTYYYDKTDIKILEKKANYPDVVDGSNSKIKKAIEEENKRLREQFDKQVEEALDLANSDVQGVNPGANDKLNEIAPYEFDNSWQVIRNDEKMLTIVSGIYSYAGGAHPNLYKEVTSYDPVEGKILTIDSITTNEKEFKRFVEDALNAYVVDNKCSDYLFGENGYKEAFKNWDKNWWILDGNLYVGFNTYDIAPYVAGPLVIPVDITKAKGLLNDYGVELFN